MSKTFDRLHSRCKPCEGGGLPRMNKTRIMDRLRTLKGWSYKDGKITKTFQFKNYYETVSFVNAAAWIAHTEDHHPDISFGYKTCQVAYSTHSIGGVSANDFICAKKIEDLLTRFSQRF